MLQVDHLDVLSSLELLIPPNIITISAHHQIPALVFGTIDGTGFRFNNNVFRMLFIQTTKQ